MEKEKLNKKQITALVIGVLTMIILVSSATYAYFRVSIGNTATSTTITGDIGGGTLGTVTLSGGGTNLYLGISAYDMSETEKGTTYYSSTTEGSRETNINNAGKTTYTATLTGDESDSVMYACDYEFTVTSTGTALTQESINDIELVFNGDINKTLNLTGSDKVSGTWFGFKKSNAEREFNAYLQLTNTEDSQNDLAGTNLSVEISNTKWNCYLSGLDELVGEAYALLINEYEDIESCVYDEETGDEMCSISSRAVPTLTFVRSETPIKVGDTYDAKTVIEVFTGFESEVYPLNTSNYPISTVPWNQYDIENVKFVDEIRPISTAGWFPIYSGSCFDYTTNININLANLNTILVTDMSGMFIMTEQCPAILEGIENLNTSKVTNMSYMFYGIDGPTNLDLSSWDVSNVTNMSHMFAMMNQYSCPHLSINVSGWNVSNVIDMSYMFAVNEFEGVEITGLEMWDTGNVTNMSNMFNSIITNSINLSNWNVSKVSSYANFSSSDNITPPIWPTN